MTGWSTWPIVWTAVSSAAARSLQRVLGGRADVTVLPNGIDPIRWRSAGTPPPISGLRMASVMRLTRRKRPLPLLRVLRDVRTALPTTVTLTADIAGDGPHRLRIERYLRRNAMESWVTLHGQLSRPAILALYANCDVFVAPAELESFGIAALEARCAGLPVVARAGTGIQEFITHGIDGLIVESDSALRQALARLARDPDLRRRLSPLTGPPPVGVSWREVVGQCDRLYGEAQRRQGAGGPGRGARSISLDGTWTAPVAAFSRLDPSGPAELADYEAAAQSNDACTLQPRPVSGPAST